MITQVNTEKSLAKILLLAGIISGITNSLWAADPSFYVKKDTWQDTVLATRQKLAEDAKSADKAQSRADQKKMWQLIERDFPSPAACHQMQMERDARIWDQDWPTGDLTVLAQRYAAAAGRTTAYLAGQAVPDYDRQAQERAKKVKTNDDLAAVRQLYYKSHDYMDKVILDEAQEGIRKYRMGTLVIKAQPNAAVTVNQLKHDFLFGSALDAVMWSVPEDYQDKRDWPLDFEYYKDPSQIEFVNAHREKYLQMVKENFNHAVHRNAMKWHNTEWKEPGNIYYTAADRVAWWCQKNDISMRGHCVTWGAKSLIQDWLKKLDKDQLRWQIHQRIRDVMNRYKGRIEEWDLNNEMVSCRWYREQLGDEIVGDMFRWAKEANPDAALFLNDYYILTGDCLEAYVEQIRDFLVKGYPVGGIGVQSHAWGNDVNLGKIRHGLDVLSQFHLPIKSTEYIPDYNTNSEEYKARLMEEFFRVCFGKPQVTGIVFFGFWEGAHWQPKHALYKLDWTPTAMAKMYRHLVFEEWWTRFEGKTDENGLCRAPVFYGRHQVEINGRDITVDFPRSQGKEKMVTVETQ